MGEGQGERETQNRKQAPGSELSARSPARGWNSRDRDLSRSQTLSPLSPPGALRLMISWYRVCAPHITQSQPVPPTWWPAITRFTSDMESLLPVTPCPCPESCPGQPTKLCAPATDAQQPPPTRRVTLDSLRFAGPASPQQTTLHAPPLDWGQWVPQNSTNATIANRSYTDPVRLHHHRQCHRHNPQLWWGKPGTQKCPAFVCSSTPGVSLRSESPHGQPPAPPQSLAASQGLCSQPGAPPSPGAAGTSGDQGSRHAPASKRVTQMAPSRCLARWKGFRKGHTAASAPGSLPPALSSFCPSGQQSPRCRGSSSGAQGPPPSRHTHAHDGHATHSPKTHTAHTHLPARSHHRHVHTCALILCAYVHGAVPW